MYEAARPVLQWAVREPLSVLPKLEQVLANCLSIEKGFRSLQTKLEGLPETPLAVEMRRDNLECIRKAERQVRVAREAIKREQARRDNEGETKSEDVGETDAPVSAQ